jgi:5-methylcytosine-specific restriction endonuclease McrA
VKNHIKVYMQAKGYKPGDWIPCEDCGAQAVDVHHIVSRGMGGSRIRDVASNLKALCRVCHDRTHGVKHVD